MSKLIGIIIVLTATLFAGCAIVPTGPSMLVLPGTGRSFEQFNADDTYCRQVANYSINGVTPQSAAAQSGVASAAVGTALGAATGAAFGGGSGAAVGAGAGLLAGSLVGASTAQSSGYEAQERYDYRYIQCMYAKGHRVPVRGNFTGVSGQTGAASPTTTQPQTLPPPPGQAAPGQSFLPPPPPR
jgi:uncharacterized protein YcfJ